MRLEWSKIDSFAGNSTSPSLTTHRPCPICASLKKRTVLQLRDFQFYSDSRELPKRVDITQVQCLECSALHMDPCYSDFGFGVLFAEAGQSYGATEGRPGEQLRWLSERGLLEPGRAVLDVGCYDGKFLAQLPAGLHKIGVDVDAAAIERARKERPEIEFIVGTFEAFECARRPDVITMFHVLEHLPRPIAALAKLRSVAHAGTRLVVEVPILENGVTNDINGFFSCQHMTHFSRRSLASALLRSGWRILERLEQPDYNGCRVLCEATGEANPDGDAGEDTLALLHYQSAWYHALEDAEKALAGLKDSRRCVVWGGGTHTEFVYQTMSFFHDPARELILVDSDKLKQGKSWRGIPIHSPEILRSVDLAGIPLVISSYGSQEAIAQAALGLGFRAEQIHRIYSAVKVY